MISSTWRSGQSYKFSSVSMIKREIFQKQSNVTSIANQATILSTKLLTPLTLFWQVMSISTLGHQIRDAGIQSFGFAIKSNILMGYSSYKLQLWKPFFLGEGGKKCEKLQLAVDRPGLSIASNAIFCLQCIDAGCLDIHPADQHPPCRHYTFIVLYSSNVAEEHQSYTSVLCCIACTFLLELL